MIHHVYANQSNIGDWLSARGIQSLLPHVRVEEHFCDTPFSEETLSKLHAAGPDDFIIIGGGGLFMDYFIPFWKGFLSIAERVPYCIWGVGYCDMKREESRPPASLISEIVRLSSLCIVRDELTRQNLSECHLPSPVICPTVVAVQPRGGSLKQLLHVDSYGDVGEEIYERMVSIAQSFAAQTARSYRQTNNLIPAGHTGRLQQTLDLYGDADLVLTSRLHACIIATAMGRPVLALSGDRKVESFMNAAGLSDWVCDLTDIDLLPSKLERLHEQRVPVDFIEQGRRDNHAVASQVRKLVSDAVRERMSS